MDLLLEIIGRRDFDDPSFPVPRTPSSPESKFKTMRSALNRLQKDCVVCSNFQNLDLLGGDMGHKTLGAPSYLGPN